MNSRQGHVTHEMGGPTQSHGTREMEGSRTGHVTREMGGSMQNHDTRAMDGFRTGHVNREMGGSIQSHVTRALGDLDKVMILDKFTLWLRLTITCIMSISHVRLMST